MKHYEKQMICGLEGLIETISTGVCGVKEFQDHLVGQDKRCKAGFYGETKRIILECIERLMFMTLPRLKKEELSALRSCEKSRIAVAAYFDEFVRNQIIPRLTTLGHSGDTFSYWMKLKSTTKEFGELYDQIAKNEDEFGFVDPTAIIAVIALVIQAQHAMESGSDNEAWMKLIDASYWLGTMKGGKIGFFTGKKHGSWTTKNAYARSNAAKKNFPNRQLREFSMKLLYEKMPRPRWQSIAAAARELRPQLQEECNRINDVLKVANRKTIRMVGEDTVEEWFRKLNEEEKVKLFSSKKPSSNMK